MVRTAGSAVSGVSAFTTGGDYPVGFRLVVSDDVHSDGLIHINAGHAARHKVKALPLRGHMFGCLLELQNGRIGMRNRMSKPAGLFRKMTR